jgi:hypothetical protein
MKGIELENANIKEILGTEIEAIPTFEWGRQLFSVVHYISGIDVFDSFFRGTKFHETAAIMQIVSCEKGFLFFVEYKQKREFFAIYRNQVISYDIEKDTNIQVRSINKLAKILKGGPVIPNIIGSVLDISENIRSRTVKGNLYKINVIDNIEIQHQIIFSSPDEKNMSYLTDEFVEKHFTRNMPSKGGGCFIATECYNGYNSKEVQAFKYYRDHVLQYSAIGLLFIRFYYLISPEIARVISKKPLIKKILRKILNKLYNTIINKYRVEY